MNNEIRTLSVIASLSLVNLVAFAEENHQIKIDGNKSDWGSPPLIKEIGGIGEDQRGGDVNLTQFYVSNDSEYLYLFIGTKPSIKERHEARRSTGALGDLYIDTDNNSATGCDFSALRGEYKVKGYDYRIGMPIGIWTDFEKQWDCFVFYSLYDVQKDGKFSSVKPILEKDSRHNREFIAHGDDGIEFKIPLKSLGLAKGKIVRLFVVEEIRIFYKRPYSEAEYTIK